MKLRLVVLGIVLAFGANAAFADPYASDWSPSAKSRARLVADGAGGAALEIELSPGAITYWRDPGEAGVPPSFDFSRSDDVANVEVEFPAPSRIPEEDGSVAFGYRERAIFPLKATAKDVSRPAALRLEVNYAVCEKLCLPARATLALVLANGVSTPYAAEVEAARARVPKKVAAEKLGADVKAIDSRHWRLCFAGAPGQSDLFVEPPAGFWLVATRDSAANCFALDLREAPAGASGAIEMTATLVGGERGYETVVTLGAAK